MQGAKDKTDGITSTMKLDYINIPILANVYVAKGFAVKLGIQPAFNVNAKCQEITADFKDGIKTIDFSIPVGISYEYMNFVIDARYNWGLTKVAKNKTLQIMGEEIEFGGKGKNSVFQITLGYKIPL